MRINKYLCGLAVGVSMLFASCNTDNIGAEYYGSNEGQGITFAAAKLTATAVQASNPQFQIPIYRSNIIGDFTGSVTATGTIDGEAADCFSVSGFTFKSGEAKTDITVDVSALEIGKVLALTLAYTDSVNMSPTNIEKVTVNVSVEYTWQSLGTGTFVDAWATGSDANPDGVVAIGIPVTVFVTAGRNTAESHLAGIVPVQTADDVQQSSLPRSADPFHCNELTFPE